MQIQTMQNMDSPHVRFSSFDVWHIDAEICEDKPKNLLKYYYSYKDIMKLKLFCPLYSLSEVEKSRLEEVQLTYVENYMIEKDDFTNKLVDFLNLLQT